MPSYGHLSPEELYKQGLQHFNRADWQGAISSFVQLQEISDQYPDVDELISDARLKLQFDGSSQPTALAPPRRPVMLPVLAAVALLLVAASAIGFYFLSSNQPPEIVAMATSTPVPPTPTTAPTAVPTTVPTPEPTDVPALPATVLITSEGTFVNSPDNIELIVDGSGSMRNIIQSAGKERWEVAQEALNTLVNSNIIPEQSNLVLRTYGRLRGDCSDLDLVQGLSRYSKEALLNVIPTLKPVIGAKTPLAESIRLAGEDLKVAEGNSVIILLTDGDETCNGDPAAAAADFVTGTDLRKVHVIGFALGDEDASNKLRRVAEVGKGLYLDANDAAQLAEALRQTITLSYQILDLNDNEIVSGTVGDPAIQLPPGKYKLVINSTPKIEKEFEVENGGTVNIVVRQGFGGLIADVNVARP